MLQQILSRATNLAGGTTGWNQLSRIEETHMIIDIIFLSFLAFLFYLKKTLLGFLSMNSLANLF